MALLFLFYRKVGVFSVFSHGPGTGPGIRSEHHFPAPSSKLCQIWLRHWRGTLYLRAAVHWRGQRPPKGSGTDKTGSNLAPKHARKHEMHPPRVKKKEKIPASTVTCGGQHKILTAVCLGALSVAVDLGFKPATQLVSPIISGWSWKTNKTNAT